MQRIAVGLFAILLSTTCASQDNAPTQRFILSTEVLQDLMLNLNLRAYCVKGRVAFGAHGSFRPSRAGNGEITPGAHYFGTYDYLNWRNWLLSSYTIGPCVKVYTLSGNGSYVELDGFYRRWGFNYKQIKYSNTEDISFQGMRSEATDVLAVRMLWGTSSTPRFKGKKRWALVIEGFGGIGYRWKSSWFDMHSGTYNGAPVIEHTGSAMNATPTLHFGIRASRVYRTFKV